MKENSRVKHRTDNAPGKNGAVSLYCFEAGPLSALIGEMVKSREVLKLGRKGKLLVPGGTLSLVVDRCYVYTAAYPAYSQLPPQLEAIFSIRK